MKIKEIAKLIEERESGHIGEEKQYSVLIPLVELYREDVKEDGQVYVLFETRSKDVNQPGEVCFPGGGREEGESLLQCALRETEEEIGIGQTGKADDGRVDVIGQFDTYDSHFGAVLYSFVGKLSLPGNASLRPFTSDDGYTGYIIDGIDINHEVADVFILPLEFFIKEEADNYEVGLIPDIPEDFPYEKITGGTKEEGYSWKMGSHHVPAYYFGEKTVWGITGRIIQRFAAVIGN